MNALKAEATFPSGLSYPDFDKKILKSEMRQAMKPLLKQARRAVSKKGTSAPGELPGLMSGDLRRNLKGKVSRSGFSFWIVESNKKLHPFYPAFVYYGHRAPRTETAREAKRHSKRSGRKVAAPRENWIVHASELYARNEWPKVGERILSKAIKPAFAK